MTTSQIVKTTVLSLGIVLFVTPAFCERPDLSGTWQLDVQASTFGTMAIPESGMMTISTGSHRMLHMAVVVRGHGDSGKVERTVESDWKIDNRFHPDEAGAILAKWDGPVLIGRRLTGDGIEEIRLVSGTGSYTLTESIQSPRGTIIRIWRRR